MHLLDPERGLGKGDQARIEADQVDRGRCGEGQLFLIEELRGVERPDAALGLAVDRVAGSRPSMWCRIGCGQRAAF
ncbi:hypothetical protein, partial [Sphingomonas sp. CCH10-B3]|uniref:hypothetical protein n=1 Tax=Sphingomonas sp. CCH10-B3 TaxID=1768757 RepID=UPI001454D865